MFGPDPRAVVGFEGLYTVSSDGEVRSVRSGRVKATWPDRDGYPSVTLSKDLRKSNAKVHRLVAQAFHASGCNVLHNEVAHLDGDRSNPKAGNLKWVSRVENHSHKTAHGTLLTGEDHPCSKLTAEAVRRIRTRYATCRNIAEEYGVSRHTIYDIWQGKSWTYLVSIRGMA